MTVSENIQASGQAGVGALISGRARAQPDGIALVDGEKQWTYREADEASDKLAMGLMARGLRHGDRIAVHLQNCAFTLLLQLAAAKTGIIVAALNWRLASPELTHCITLVSPKLIVEGEGVDALAAGVVTGGVPRTTPKELQADSAVERTTKQLVHGRGENGLVILYTSGTTGMPKGALVSHRAMVARAAAFALDLGLRPTDGFIAWAPLFHMASMDHSLATLMQGGTVHVVNGYRPDDILDVLENHRIGWFVLMPGMIAGFTHHAETRFAARGTSTAGIVACGAMADLVPAKELAAVTRVLNCPYLNTFGATETGLPPASANTIAPGEVPRDLRKKQSRFCDVRLVDEMDNDVLPGQPGELAIRGPTVFSGYWNAAETNAYDFRNGWFHMGDVLRRNDDGTLSYVDRVKYMIKSGGENIYPAEIESIILRDARVETAVVVRRKSDQWGEEPVVFIVFAEGAAPLSPVEWDTMFQGSLASYKRPKGIFVISDDQLPRSATGKIQRHELEKRLS